VIELSRELRRSYALVERNFNLIKRYIGWEIVFLVYTVVNTLTIAFIGVSPVTGGAGAVPGAAAGDSGDRVLYLVVGALLWGFLSVLFHEVAESVQWERWEGTIEYSFMAPMKRLSYLGGVCLFAASYGAMRTVVVMLAVVSLFKLDLGSADLGAALVVLLLSSLSFIGVGLMAAVLPLLSPEKGSQAAHILEAAILLVSGVYYEVDVLPAWLKPLSRLSPATYTLRAARAALLRDASIREIGGDLVLLLIIGAVLIPLGLRVFNWGELHAMRTGKLKRSG
jgi:ABC-2 type transport system permease protein